MARKTKRLGGKLTNFSTNPKWQSRLVAQIRANPQCSTSQTTTTQTRQIIKGQSHLDLVTERSIRNPYFREEIEQTRQPVYVA